MPEPVILHVCPHCERVFSSPSICMESGQHTVPTPDVVPTQTFDRLREQEGGERA